MISSLPSWNGSTASRKGLLPRGASTAFAIASATSCGVASFGKVLATLSSMIVSAPFNGPCMCSAAMSGKAGLPAWAKWLVPEVNIPGKCISHASSIGYVPTKLHVCEGYTSGLTRHDYRRLNAPASNLCRAGQGERVHGRFGSEIGSQQRPTSSTRARGAHPDDVTTPRLAHQRKHRLIEPVGAHGVDVVVLMELLRREGFGRAHAHVARVVHHTVELPGLRQDLLDGGVDGLLVRDVEDNIADGVLAVLLCAPGAMERVQASIHRVAGFGEGFSRTQAKATSSSGDEHGLRHVMSGKVQ